DDRRPLPRLGDVQADAVDHHVAVADTGKVGERDQIFSRMKMLMTNASANAIVHRLRLRSTSDPPPNGPAPVPTPKAPDSPVSLPEWSRTRTMSITARKTWNAMRIDSTIAGTG